MASLRYGRGNDVVEATVADSDDSQERTSRFEAQLAEVTRDTSSADNEDETAPPLRRSRRNVERSDSDAVRELSLRDTVPHHDEYGRLCLPDGRCVDLCDCLSEECLGCHFDCDVCGSRKCAIQCRRNRPFYFDRIVSDGRPEFNRVNPYTQQWL